MINLNQFNHLVALAEECHFARAAARVHLSQPAFSRSIQAIERSVDMRLFERDIGDVRPTPGGVFLIERARQLLFDARCVERDIGLYRDSQLGDTAFGVGPFPAATLVRQIVTEVRQLYPKVGLRVEVGNWKNLLEQLRLEDIEFFVADTRDIPLTRTLDIQPLVRYSGGFFVRKGHALLDGKLPTLQEAWGYGVAATRIPAPIKAMLGQYLGLPAEEFPKLILECDDVRILHQLAMDTDTVVATTEVAVQLHAQSLQRLQVTNFPEVFVDIGIVSLRRRTPSPMAQRVIQILKQMVLQGP